MLDIITKNNQFIVINKPVGIPTQADKTGDASLLQMAEAYCKHPLHVVNRLDRPVSGLVVFAKSTTTMTMLQRQFSSGAVVKSYLAVVQELPPVPEGNLVHYITKNEAKNTVSIVKETHHSAERAELHYRIVSSSDRYHLLEIQLITGKHHQIRAQLADLGCPIKGDVKYGFRRGNKDRSIHLHAYRLEFEHPVSGEKTALKANLPDESLWNSFAIAIAEL